MKIYFENCGYFITAAENGNVLIRCNFSYTDCGWNEDIDFFVIRHGGSEQTVQYLKNCYSAANKL